MAGHSKWANIQHRKGRQDAKRGKLFTKLIREITVAAKLGGSGSSANPRLRAAIDNGLSNNMTKDTIDRAVKRGAGGDESGNVDEIRYEGYGPNGVAVIVDTMTDNKTGRLLKYVMPSQSLEVILAQMVLFLIYLQRSG